MWYCSPICSFGGKPAVLLVKVMVIALQLMQVWSLRVGFYARTCPAVEAIVSKLVWHKSRGDQSLPAALLRLHYHDCFVTGCDASVLLDGARGYPPPEKLAEPNQTLRGFEVIDFVKKVLEVTCPLTVSCSDILALAAREAVVVAGGPWWAVPTGRRDGRLSSALHATISLPKPQSSVAQLKKNFILHGLSEEEMITLSGSHTIGSARCASIWNRLYNHSFTTRTDPSMNSTYASQLKKICSRRNRYSRVMVPLDPSTPFKFDNMYYKNLEEGRGLLASDQGIFDASISKLSSNSVEWESRFLKAMVHLGNLNVKTGRYGEIRRNCRRRN